MVARTAKSTRWAIALTLGLFCAAMPYALGDETASADTPPRGFHPGDITTGEPIPLPFVAPRSEITPPPPSSAVPGTSEPRSLLSNPPRATALPSAQARGTGWIGLQVAESTEPGRWAIADVTVGGPAAGAGIGVGDELRAIDGVQIKSDEDVAQALTSLAPGQRVSLAVARGGQVLDVSLIAVERPVALTSRTWQASPEPAAATHVPSAPPPFVSAPPPFVASSPPFGSPDSSGTNAGPAAAVPVPSARASAPPASPLRTPSHPSSPTGRTALGVRTLPIGPDLQTRFKLPDAAGAYVIGVVQDLPASRAGVPPGSVIVSLDNRPVRSPDELTRLVTSSPVGRPVTLQYILPGGASQQAEVVLQSLDRPLETALIGTETPTVSPVPQLVPGPPATSLRRPESGGITETMQSLEAEVRELRSRLEQLEQRVGLGVQNR